MKKIIQIIALCMSILMVVSCFSGCNKKGLDDELSFDVSYENTNGGSKGGSKGGPNGGSKGGSKGGSNGLSVSGDKQSTTGNSKGKNNGAKNKSENSGYEFSEKESSGNGSLNTTGFPIVKNKVTLKVLCNSMPLHVNGFDNMAWNKDYEKKTGVHIQWELMESNQNEKIVSVLASGKLPDVIISYSAMRYSQMETYSKNGLFLSLSESEYKKYAPNAWKAINSTKGAKAAMTLSDGKIYSMPSIRVDMSGDTYPSKLFINKTWLDNLGLSVPTTYASFLNVMKKFVSGDPNRNGTNDELGLVMNGADYLMTASPFGIEVAKKYDKMYVDSAGKTHYYPATEQYRKAMKFLNKLYAAKALEWKSFMGSSSVAEVISKGKAGAFIALSISSLSDNYVNDYVCIAPLKADNTSKVVSQTSRGEETQAFNMVITSAAKSNNKKEIAMRWADYFYTPKGYFYKEFGPEGYYYKANKDGTYSSVTEKVNGKLKIKYTDSERYQWAPGYVIPGWSKGANDLWKDVSGITLSNAQLWNNKNGKAMMNTYKKIQSKNYISYGSLKFDSKAEASLTTYSSTLHKYVENTIPSFVSGSWDVDTNWSQYQSELERLGLSKLEKTYQTYYNKSK